MRAAPLLLALGLGLLVPAAADAAPAGFVNEGLVATASIPSNARDHYGDTLGGIGSGMALLPGTWRKTDRGYEATLIMLPDRGWNMETTVDYRARLQRFALKLTPVTGKAAKNKTGLALTYQGTLLLSDAQGRPTTALNPEGIRPAKGAMPALPLANGHVSMDSEALALARDGTIWVGDEYGPYIYHFDAKGRMIGAIQPPASFLPMRYGKLNFSAEDPVPQSGRMSNHGFEGMSLSPDGKHLFALTQSALVEDEDWQHADETRRYVRLVEYDIAGHTPKLIHEYVVPLPLHHDKGKVQVEAQSELYALGPHRFLFLCRDKGRGYGAKHARSRYRNITVLDTKGATDIAGREHGIYAAAPGGRLRADIAPARVSDFLDMNDDKELARFGLHNGKPNDASNLYEKWESMALAPTGTPGEYFLIVGSDNDFITQDGTMAGKPYKDKSGLNVDTRVLVYRVRLPM